MTSNDTLTVAMDPRPADADAAVYTVYENSNTHA